MSGRLGQPFEALAAIAAVVTLPVGLLAAIFLGVIEAAVVFVVGWLLLVPLFGVVSEALGGEESDAEEVERWLDVAERAKTMKDEEGGATSNENPLETLRERYARGALDDDEFEARLERLVATEEIPPEALDPVDPSREAPRSAGDERDARSTDGEGDGGGAADGEAGDGGRGATDADASRERLRER